MTSPWLLVEVVAMAEEVAAMAEEVEEGEADEVPAHHGVMPGIVSVAQ